MPHIAGPYRPAIAHHRTYDPLAVPVGLPGLGAIAIRSLRSLPREVALRYFGHFLAEWGTQGRAEILQNGRAGDDADAQLKALDAVTEESLGEPTTLTAVQANRVYILARAGRLDEAVKAAAQFEAANPVPGIWHGYVGAVLGEELVRAGRLEEAKAVYRRTASACGECEPQYARLALKALIELARLAGDQPALEAATAQLRTLPTEGGGTAAH